MNSGAPLTPNGLVPHADFPTKSYEAVHMHVAARWAADGGYGHYSGAWNALAYRFHGAIEAGSRFRRSLRDYGSHPGPQQRFQQEEALFNLFSNGFAAFEALFYGLFAIGSFIDAGRFPLATSKDRQRVSPTHTSDAYERAFPNDPLLNTFSSLFDDSAYKRWRDMRNVLTHRAAPGRRVYVGLGSDDAPPVEWKLNDMPLDDALVPTRQRELAQLISGVVSATEVFLKTRA